MSSPASVPDPQTDNPLAAFRRISSPGHLILFGITFVGPAAAFPTFGVVEQHPRGHMALASLIAMVVMMLSAFSYGRMAAALPEAGSAYAYAGKAPHPSAGIVAGRTILLDHPLMPLMSVIDLSLLPPRIFAYIHPKYSTPTFSIAATVAVTLLGGFLFSFQLAAEAINFRVPSGFMFVNLSVISHYILRGGTRYRSSRNLLLPEDGFLRMPPCFRESLGHREAWSAWGGAPSVAERSLANAWNFADCGAVTLLLRWRTIEREFTY
jgi:amino acid transporter